jgi:putative spermidine/putrescine transport system ATP-binding protein
MTKLNPIKTSHPDLACAVAYQHTDNQSVAICHAEQSQLRSSAKLQVTGISKKYADTYALRESTLSLRQGEFVTLLGPSGSGKTTLLMMIAGLVTPTSGDIWIDGRKSTQLQPYERDIGMMFQSYALFPHMTVFENIAFPLKMKGCSKDRIYAAVMEVLEQVKLPHVKNRFPSELSGGQQQRIALARSVVHRPSVVLMDEPLAALDKSLRTHMQEEIRQLQQELGITVLYVTHDQEEAMTMSDRICLMNDARIEQVAKPHDLYFAPKSVFAATFLGESNRLHGVVESVGGHYAKVRIRDDLIVTGKLSDALRPGATCQVLVRPEAVDVSDGTNHEATNRLHGTVTSHVIAGALARTRMLTEDGIGFVSVKLTARNAGGPTGGAAMSFRSDDALIFGAEQ